MVFNKSEIINVWIRRNDSCNDSCTEYFTTDTYSIDIDTDCYSVTFPFATISGNTITAFNENNTRSIDITLE